VAKYVVIAVSCFSFWLQGLFFAWEAYLYTLIAAILLLCFGLIGRLSFSISCSLCFCRYPAVSFFEICNRIHEMDIRHQLYYFNHLAARNGGPNCLGNLCSQSHGGSCFLLSYKSDRGKNCFRYCRDCCCDG